MGPGAVSFARPDQLGNIPQVLEPLVLWHVQVHAFQWLSVSCVSHNSLGVLRSRERSVPLA
jgi:hypothetical protein